MQRLSILLLRTFVLLVLTSAAFNPLITQAASKKSNWSQWRGSDGTGVSTETNLPREWSSGKNIKWKTPLSGSGHSSPIVWNDKVFITSEIEGEVVAGAQAVKHVNEGEDYKHPDAVAADRHHTFKVLCLARDNGKLLWEQTPALASTNFALQCALKSEFVGCSNTDIKHENGGSIHE